MAVREHLFLIRDHFMTTAQSAFLEYHKQNPHIYEEYLRFSHELHAAGIRRKSISMITERIRWNTATRGTGEFKIPNSLRAGYSRLLIWKNPEFRYSDCFILKTSSIDGMFSVDFTDLSTWDNDYWNSFPTRNL